MSDQDAATVEHQGDGAGVAKGQDLALSGGQGRAAGGLGHGSDVMLGAGALAASKVLGAAESFLKSLAQRGARRGGEARMGRGGTRAARAKAQAWRMIVELSKHPTRLNKRLVIVLRALEAIYLASIARTITPVLALLNA